MENSWIIQKCFLIYLVSRLYLVEFVFCLTSRWVKSTPHVNKHRLKLYSQSVQRLVSGIL